MIGFTMVYAIVYEFRCGRKREVMRGLGCIRVGESSCLMDASDKDARSVYARIVGALAVATGLDDHDVIGHDERLYVIPISHVAGHGAADVDGWIDRRKLLRPAVAQAAWA